MLGFAIQVTFPEQIVGKIMYHQDLLCKESSGVWPFLYKIAQTPLIHTSLYIIYTSASHTHLHTIEHTNINYACRNVEPTFPGGILLTTRHH